jgi:hypothetical protein
MAPFLAGGAVTFYLINAAQEAALKSTYSICRNTPDFFISGSVNSHEFQADLRLHTLVYSDLSTVNDLSSTCRMKVYICQIPALFLAMDHYKGL